MSTFAGPALADNPEDEPTAWAVLAGAEELLAEPYRAQDSRSSLSAETALLVTAPADGAVNGEDGDAVPALDQLLRDIYSTRSSSTEVVPCTSGESELWFSDVPAEVEVAKASCLGCPHREPCLAGALARREPRGVWGGEQFRNGEVRGPRRPRRRTRKT